jgi:hypothetical protein
MFNLLIYVCTYNLNYYTRWYHNLLSTHRQMRLDEWVQPYLFQISFLYVNCLDHFNIDLDLIYALIGRWRHETHTFYHRRREMTPTLQDMVILLGLPIDGRAVIYFGVHNRIVLCKRSFRFAPFILN